MKRSTLPGSLGFCLLSAFLAPVLRSDVELVRDGKPMAEIVMATNALPSVRLAADDLQKHIERMSGARLLITNAPSQGVKSHVYVGPSDAMRRLGVTATDLPVGGFKIVARGNALILIGHDEKRVPAPFGNRPESSLKAWQEFAGEKYTWAGATTVFNAELGIFHDEATATLYAVSEFLEQLGVRWYYPYEDGTVIPHKPTIIVPEQTLRKEPNVPYRHFNYYGVMRADAEGVLWFKHLKYGVPYGLMYGHTTGDVLGQGAQQEAHPEYFARVDGKLINVPRLSDPGFRRASINFVSKSIQAWPWLNYVNLAPTDGLGRIDEHDAKVWRRSERGRKGWASDYVWDYWLYAARELKRLHPDCYLRCNSYAPYALPPTQVEKLPDNVAICIAVSTAGSFLNQDTHDQIRDEWVSLLTSGKLFVYDFYLFYRPQSPRYPVFFTHHLQREMRALCDTGVFEGKFTEIWAEPGVGLGSPALTHLLHYWQGKLYWDVDADREALLEEYYRLYFGPARVEMKEFHEFAEDVWMRPESRSVTRSGGFTRPEDVNRYFDLLKRARMKAGKDTVYDRRIARIEEEMAPLKTQFSNFQRRTGPYLHAYTPERVYKFPHDFDADLDKKFWRGQRFYEWYAMRDPVTGVVPDKNRTSVSFRMTRDGSALIVGVECHEARMDQLVVHAKERGDRSIFEDDTIEIVIATPERSYFRIVVNAAGTVWEESHDPTIVERDTLPELWDPGIRTAVRHTDDRWSLEILIPRTDFGALGPSRDFPWGVNVGRMRRAGGVQERFAVAPTGKAGFFDLVRMGDLAMGDTFVARFQTKAPAPTGFPGDFLAAAEMFSKKDYADAQTAFLNLAEAAPTPESRAECLARAATALGLRGEHEAALELAQGIETVPVSIKCRMEILSAAGKFKELTEAFGDADIATWPDALNYKGFHLRGSAWVRVGNRAAARADFERCAALAGSDDRVKNEAEKRAAALRPRTPDAR